MRTTGPKLPAIAATDLQTVVAAVNDRLRRIETLTTAPAAAATSGGASAAAAAGTSGTGQLILYKPGILGIQSSATPLVSLPADQTPTALVVMLGRAPVGGPLTVAVTAGGSAVGGVTLPEGATTGTVGAGLSKIPANSIVVVAITEVGLTFPGADLTVMVRF